MKALLIVDLQNDFLDGGALEVKGSVNLIHLINGLMEKFPLVLASKDWHPKGHCSFVSSHSEKALWPDHCIQHTSGAMFPSSLHDDKINKIFYKGSLINEDSYSAFFVGEKGVSTGLNEYLKEHGVKELYLAGVALEYCVLATALDAIKLGYNVTVIQDAVASISIDQKEIIFEKLNSFHASVAKTKEIMELLRN
jgi:nicotinamidase/pyrazinamidase